MRIAILGAALLSATCAYAEPALELTPCFVKGVKSQAKCATFAVPEDRSQPISQNNTIDLNIVVLPKFKEGSNKAPVLFLAGGPGQAATELAGVINRSFNKIRQEHDILLVDQRGTGQSSPLRCPMPDVDALSFDDSNVDVEKEVATCLDKFTGRDLRHYNTYESIADFEAVREALGYPQVHLFGGSYGTRAGFAYLKWHPESVKTATLDSNAPMDLVIGFFGKTAEQAFDLLLGDCQQHGECAERYPHIKQDFLELIGRLEEGPVKTALFHPQTGEPTELVLTRSKVIEALRGLLYDMTSRQMVPYIVHHAANQDYRALAAILSQNDDPNAPGSLYTGLTMNIICNEDMPRATDQDFHRDRDNYFSKELGVKTFQDVCQYWPKWQRPADFETPVKTDVPVLLFSGKYDPVTPPAYADMALDTLTNARHVVIEHGSHVASLDACNDAIKQFIETANVTELDVSCATEASTRLFLLDKDQLR